MTSRCDSERTKLDIQPLGSQQRVLPNSRFVRSAPLLPHAPVARFVPSPAARRLPVASPIIAPVPEVRLPPRRLPAATPNAPTILARPVQAAVIRAPASVSPHAQPSVSARVTPTTPPANLTIRIATRDSASTITLHAEPDTSPYVPALEAPRMAYTTAVAAPVAMAGTSMADPHRLIEIVPAAVMAALAARRQVAAPVEIHVPYLPAVAEIMRLDDARARRPFTKRSLLAANLGALCAVVAIVAGYLAT